MAGKVDAGPEITGAALMRSGLWSALGHVLPQIYLLLASIAAARFLGPDDFGRQSYIAFVGLSVQLVLSSGMGIATMRSVAEAIGRREPDRARGLLRWAWQVQLFAAVLGGGALIVVASLGASPPAAWVLIAISTAIGILHAVPTAALLGAQRFQEAVIAGVVTGAVAVPAVVAVLALGGGIVGMFAVEAVAVGANLVWIALLSRRILRRLAPRSAPAPELQRSAVRFAAWSTLSALVTLVVWRRSEFFFLASYSTDAQIGIYSIAFAMVTALTMLLERVASVFLSAFATLRGAGAADRIRSGYGRALRLLVIVTLPLTAGVIAVGPALLETIYGTDYRGAGPVLVILAGATPLVAVMFVASALLSGLGDAKTPLVAGAAAAVVNVALAFALIPSLDAVGAALANVGGQLMATAFVFMPARRAAGGVAWETASLLRAAAASAACGGVSWGALQLVGGPAGVVLAILTGAAVFCALAIALRILSAGDGAWVDANLGRQLGGRVGVLAQRVAWRGRAAA